MDVGTGTKEDFKRGDTTFFGMVLFVDRLNTLSLRERTLWWYLVSTKCVKFVNSKQSRGSKLHEKSEKKISGRSSIWGGYFYVCWYIKEHQRTITSGSTPTQKNLSFFLSFSLSLSLFLSLSLSLSLSYSDYIFSNGSIINKRKPLSRTCRKALK